MPNALLSNPLIERVCNGADSRIRTDDLLITNQLLYQLSYAGIYKGKLLSFTALSRRIVYAICIRWHKTKTKCAIPNRYHRAPLSAFSFSRQADSLMRFRRGQLHVRGDPQTATKNGEMRYVPMIPEFERMLKELRAERANEPLNTTVMRVFECQNSMTHAAARIGMKRITHHDLRHLFATICIESGVGIPTVSRWLGHKDGGALC
jgi:integrase